MIAPREPSSVSVSNQHDAVGAPGTGRSRWPYAPASTQPMPDMLPDATPWPRISIVTPTYNQGKFIEETILSVLNQGYPNVEHIIVDAGSTDQTGEILDRYRDRVARIIQEPDEGQSDAINKGFSHATGEIFTWLNSDDMLAPGALAGVALGLHTSGADLVAGECHVFRDARLEHRHLTSCADGPLPLDDQLDLERCWLAGQFFYQPEVMYTRDLWERAGGFVSNEWRYSMDYDLWLRFAEVGARLHVIGRPIALFRAHEEQKTAETEDTEAGGFRIELPKAVAAFRERTGRPNADVPAFDVVRRLRVVLFNDIGYKYGAGIAHRRIAEALVTAGHHVEAISAEDVRFATGGDIVESIAARRPDLVVIGNIHAAALPPGIVGRIAERFPTALLLHDVWMLTGGCAYAFGCTRYLTGCDQRCTCPSAYPKPESGEIRRQWEAKRRALGADASLVLLANSRWTQGVAEEAAARDSSMTSPVSWVKFGIELDVMRPRDKSICRELLGLDRDAFILLTSASSLADDRKGFAHLVDAVKILDLPDLQVVGTGYPRSDERPPIDNLRLMGYVHDPLHLAMLYSAADVFVAPSLEEAFGQVFIEAAACGTPSVGYPVGGVPEALLDGVSGRLAETVSPRALAAAIGELHDDVALRTRMSRLGRLWVENTYSMSASASRFFNALREVGLEGRIGLSRKLSLALEPVRVPDPIQACHDAPFWTTESGFAGWEGPLPEVKLDPFRWALGPVSRLAVHTTRGGKHLVALRLRNFHRDQRLRVMVNGARMYEESIPVTGHKDEHLVKLEADLTPGPNEIELHHWRWNLQNPGRPIALIISGIHALRMDDL
jgi:glycosyltransferase involved in cell wall biosynthesis